MSLLSNYKTFIKHKLVILFLILVIPDIFSQQSEPSEIRFILIDNTFITEKNLKLYILSEKNNSADTIYPQKWNINTDDTLYFKVTNYKNPVILEASSETLTKQSNRFNILPKFTYSLTILDDTLLVKTRPLVFDNFDNKAKTLYTFIIKLVIEILLAIPLAALLRLPPRLYFFVFVANIMSFPILYVPYISPEIKEILTIVLEGLFIFAIGWKRLKIPKAMLVSAILNILRFGIAKLVMLVIKIV